MCCSASLLCGEADMEGPNLARGLQSRPRRNPSRTNGASSKPNKRSVVQILPTWAEATKACSHCESHGMFFRWAPPCLAPPRSKGPRKGVHQHAGNTVLPQTLCGARLLAVARRVRGCRGVWKQREGYPVVSRPAGSDGRGLWGPADRATAIGSASSAAP